MQTQDATDSNRAALLDTLQRPLRDLRISLTDACNFRCTYCMPRQVFGPGYEFLHRGELLSREEIVRLAWLFAECGVTKIRLTGGEPLLRHELIKLVAQLADVQGIEDIALTTNGVLLTESLAKLLKGAGLSRVTVSLDALDNDVFMAMNDARVPVAPVLRAIDAALAAGLAPVKVNMVVKRGSNDGEVVCMAEHFRGTGVVLRFIEYMDVGNTNQWRIDDVVPAHEIFHAIHARWPLEAVHAPVQGRVARQYRYADGQGEIGIIASVTQAFCGGCTRARLSPEGALYTCLFGASGFDLRAMLRNGSTDGQILDAIRAQWSARDDRYSELRAQTEHGPSRRKVEMSHIGG